MLLKRLVGFAHQGLVVPRRASAIARAVAAHISGGLVLDVGCGDGTISRLLGEMRSDVTVFGLEVKLRRSGSIPIVLYNGTDFPLADASLATVVIVDSLHHAENAEAVLSECMRVAQRSVIVKDHFCEGWMDRLVLRVLDWVGNSPHAVPLRDEYFSRAEWSALLQRLRAAELWRTEAVEGQYPGPFQHWLGRGVQFVAKLTMSGSQE